MNNKYSVREAKLYQTYERSVFMTIGSSLITTTMSVITNRSRTYRQQTYFTDVDRKYWSNERRSNCPRWRSAEKCTTIIRQDD